MDEVWAEIDDRRLIDRRHRWIATAVLFILIAIVAYIGSYFL